MDFSTNIEEGPRKRVPRAIFTPTQRSSATISKYYLLFFEDTESYQVVAKSSIKKIDDQGLATLSIHNKAVKGKIFFQGSLENCEKELGRQTRLSQQDDNNNEKDLQEAEDETNEAVVMPASKRRRLTTESAFKVVSPLEFDLSQSENDETENVNQHSDDDDDEMLEDHFSRKKQHHTKKRKRSSNRTHKKTKRVKTKPDNYVQTNKTNSASEITFSGVSILNMLENTLSELTNKLVCMENKNDQKMAQLTTKVDRLMTSVATSKTMHDQYRDENNQVFQQELMYNGINLLATIASSVGDFARTTMKIVFSDDELKTHVLPPKRSYLARPSLDEERFQLVNAAVRIKFKLDAAKYSMFYKNILRRKLSDFLIEERRRETTKMARRLLKKRMTDNPT